VEVLSVLSLLITKHADRASMIDVIPIILAAWKKDKSLAPHSGHLGSFIGAFPSSGDAER
jgi:hypothetical protein